MLAHVEDVLLRQIDTLVAQFGAAKARHVSHFFRHHERFATQLIQRLDGRVCPHRQHALTVRFGVGDVLVTMIAQAARGVVRGAGDDKVVAPVFHALFERGEFTHEHHLYAVAQRLFKALGERGVFLASGGGVDAA